MPRARPGERSIARRDPRNTAALESRMSAIELRRQGLGYREIAKRLGISTGSAYTHVQDALREGVEKRPEKIELQRGMELERLDAYTRELQTEVDSSDPKIRIRAIEALVRVSHRRSGLLGLNAPVKLEHTGADVAALIPDAATALEALARSLGCAIPASAALVTAGDGAAEGAGESTE